MKTEPQQERDDNTIIKPDALLIKYKESQRENDPVINYESCQQLQEIEKLDTDETTHLKESARLQMSENARLRMERNGYREYYIHCLSYKNLWYSACEDVARLREERDKYHELFLDAKDETFAHEVEEANRLYSMFKSANANRFADVNIELNQKKGL